LVKTSLRFLTGLSAVIFSSVSIGQSYTAADWTGIWIAEGTLFTLAVTVEGKQLYVDSMESLGFQWGSKDGRVISSLQAGSIEVSYEGVSGRLRIDMLSPTTAKVAPINCTPEFNVVCILIRGQQAVFRKK